MKAFHDWNEFVRYTQDGQKFDLRYVKGSEFLAPLLQNLALRPCIKTCEPPTSEPVRSGTQPGPPAVTARELETSPQDRHVPGPHAHETNAAHRDVQWFNLS